MKKLVIITDAFPWGKGERSFILPELEYLRKEFKVVILSRAPMGLCGLDADRASIPEDVKVVHYPEPELGKKDKLAYLCAALLSNGFRKEMKGIKDENKGTDCLKQTYFFWIKAVKFQKWLRKSHFFDDLENTIFYSYWANYSVYSLAMEKSHNPSLKFVSRIHRYDLYNEYFLGGRQPFKKYVDQWIDKMVFIAKEGKEYYLEQFAPNKQDNERYTLCRLGVERQIQRCEDTKEDVFHLVSCAAVSDRKRVGLIVEALAKLEGSIEWHHFGDGPLFEEIREMAETLLDKKKNIRYVLHGFTPNAEVIRYYRENPVDCFILTSSNEGCPVSIQEALSFGIPVIGTDVGEIKYMIENNGVLLPADPMPDEVAAAIQTVFETKGQDREIMRKNSQAIWERDYQLEQNAMRFINILKSV